MSCSIWIRVFLAILLANFCYTHNCTDKMIRQADANIAKLLTIANSGRKFPTSKGAPLKKWCDESERLVKQLEVYKTKCLDGLSWQVYSLSMYSIKKLFGQYCKKDSKRLNTLLEAVPCVNNNDALITQCYTDLIDGLLGAQNGPDNKKIPYLCCEQVKIYSCLEKKLTNAPSCNSKRIQTVTDILRSLSGNAINLMCGDYVEGTDMCQKLGPPPKKKSSQKRSKSFGPPLLGLLSSFPEFN